MSRAKDSDEYGVEALPLPTTPFPFNSRLSIVILLEAH
jgi:hypothetical protein